MNHRHMSGASVSESNDLRLKKLCYACVDDSYLRLQLKQGKRRKCSYCGKVRSGFRLDEVAELTVQAFARHFSRTPDGPDDFEYMLLADKESAYEWFREGSPVVTAIMEAAEIAEGPAQDLQQILEEEHNDWEAAQWGDETEFARDSFYEVKWPGTESWHDDWLSFERSLKTEARFFSRRAESLLREVFGGVNEMRTHEGLPLVITAGPETSLTSLFRARVFQAEPDLEEALARPDLHIGPPPPRLARAGRMNSHGISVFYGGTTAEVVLAEVRPPVGSRVIVAVFDIIRPLRLLDLSAVERVRATGSYYDPAYADLLARLGFLTSLAERIAKAVMPDDELFEYLPTQAVADFLASDEELNIDGVLLPSSQTSKGMNIVLFHKAARVLEITVPEEASLRVTTGGFMAEEEWEYDYSVTAETPSIAAKVSCEKPDELDDLDFDGLADRLPSGALDSREPALEVQLGSVWVHHVKSVIVDTCKYSVTRSRYTEDEDNDF